MTNTPGQPSESGNREQHVTMRLGAEQKRETAATGAPPQVAIETKFMESYRLASPVNAGGDSVAVCNGSGQVELFTQGTDGTIWNVYPDPNSDTGYSFISTSLQGATFTASVDSEGRIVVIAGNTSDPNHIYFVYENGTGASRWSAVTTVDLPAPITGLPGGVTTITAQQIAGSLYVAVIILNQAATGYMVYSTWDTASPVFAVENYVAWSPGIPTAWIGNSADTAAFAAYGYPNWSEFNFSQQQRVWYDMTGAGTVNETAAANDVNGNTQVFSILADGNLYQLIANSDGTYTWLPLSENQSFMQLAADTDGAGAIHVFMVGNDNQIYHWTPAFDGPPVPIYANVATIALAANDGGAIDIFAIGTAQNTLTHLYQDEVSGNWVAQSVEVATNGSIETYISYSTDLTFTDADGVALINQAVSVSASEECRLTINGGVYFVSSSRPAILSTNASAMLSIAQETGSLSVPTLYATLTGSGTEISLEQPAGVQQTLATVTADDLLNAQGANGNLLQGTYRTIESAQALAAVCNECAALAGPAPSTVTGKSRRHRAKPGVSMHPVGSPRTRRRISPPAGMHSWQISFAGGAPVYRALTQAEAAAILAEKRATIQSADGFFDWVSDIGDFIEDVVADVVEVVDYVVTEVGNAVEATFTILYEGFQYLYTATVDFVEQAFDILEATFAEVEAAFEDLFAWLGFVFDWADILRTQQALVYTINQYMGFLSGSASGVQALFDQGIDNFQQTVASSFAWAIQQIGGSSIGGYATSNEPPDPDVDSSMSNNVIYNALIDNLSAATSAFNPVVTGPVSDFVTQLENYIDLQEAGAAWANAQTYFTNMVSGSPDQMFTSLLSGLLEIVEALVQAALSGAQAIVDALLQLVATLVDTIQSALAAAWDIPFLSELYSLITDGDELSTLSLVCLLAAMPATVLYKIAMNAAPFPDAASVTTFEDSFSAATMLQAAGLAQLPAGQTPLTGGMLSPTGNMVMSLGAAGFGAFYTVLTTSLDAVPPTLPTPAIANWAAFLMSVGGQGCTFPWFSSDAATNCTTTDGRANVLWIYHSLAGTLLDGVFMTLGERLPETSSDVGVWSATLYGWTDLALSISASMGASSLDVAGNILPTIPEVFKFCRLTAFAAGTGGNSVVFLAGMDFVFYTATTAITAFSGLQQGVTDTRGRRRARIGRSVPALGQPALVAATT